MKLVRGSHKPHSATLTAILGVCRCPCYDAAASNTGVDIQELAVFIPATTGSPTPLATAGDSCLGCAAPDDACFDCPGTQKD